LLQLLGCGVELQLLDPWNCSMMDSSSSSSSSGMMSSSRMLLIMILGTFLLLLSSLDLLVQVVEAQGSWEVVVENAGIASMHTAVTYYGTVVLLDRTDIGASQLPYPMASAAMIPTTR
jgi:hypothetical protein